MGLNFAMVAVVAFAFQAALPFAKTNRVGTAGNAMLSVALGLWAYIFASLFRMLPLFVVVE